MLIFIFSPKADFSENENRKLQSFPEFSIKNVSDGSFTTDLSDYLSDHFPFRDAFINIKTGFEQNGLRQKLINNIYICSDGYRIEKYDKQKNADSIIESLNQFSSSCKSEPYIMLVPTAVSVYDDKLPVFADSTTQLADLTYYYEHLKGFNKIDVFKDLYSNKKNEQLFYKLDHHWTTDGAYLGYVAYCEALNITPIARDKFDIQIVSESFKGTIYSKLNDFLLQGDAIKLYNYANNLTVKYDGKLSDSLYAYDYLEKKDKYSFFLNNLNSMIEIKNNDIHNGKNLVIAKDSYANCLVPFLVNHYENIYVFDTRSYKKSVSEFANGIDNCDILILYNMNTIDNDTGIKMIY